MANAYPPDDSEYREGRVIRVDNGSFEGDDGWCLGIPDGRIFPAVGSTYRVYGRSIGYPVRGLFFDGRRVFYRTEAEQEKHCQREAEEAERKRREEFEQSRSEMDARYDALPSLFRERVDKFRRNNPDFRWKYELYELFVCEEAVNIAEECGSPEAVQQFSQMTYDQQREHVVLRDGHSGNTFGMACRLAYIYLAEPSSVVLLHGALAPLVGSEEYGCVPRTRAAAVADWTKRAGDLIDEVTA